jgi:Protein of unknown function (DUF3634)
LTEFEVDRAEASQMALFLKLGLVALAAWAIWSVFRPRPAFVVRIKNGVPRVARGTVTPAFLHQIGETCSRHHVGHGVVRGVIEGRRIALSFSHGIPPTCRQQLRNLWTLTGWSTNPRPKQR